MIQTDAFGRFNADIIRFDGIKGEMIKHCTTKLRDQLVAVCQPRNRNLELDNYINLLIQDYRDLAHLIHSIYHW